MTDIQQIRDTIELTHNPDRIGADEEAPAGDVAAGVDGQEAAR